MAEVKNRDLRTEAIVLKRTNYGETDRILSILTPEGKKSVLAKGVRKERSKLAGGIEMFCCSEVVLHRGKGELQILTSAKMKKFYKNILAGFEALEIASEILKRINKATNGVGDVEYYKITKECLEALDSVALGEEIKSDDPAQAKATSKTAQEAILAWFYFNVARVGGEQANLFYDINGEKLVETERYNWDDFEKALRPVAQGRIGAEEIKMMRLMLATDLKLVLRVKNTAQMIPELLHIAKTLNVI